MMGTRWGFTISYWLLFFPPLFIYFLFYCFPRWSFSLLPLSLSRLWSSWIPNFSRCLTWSKPTGPTGRNWTRRDSVARASQGRRAPAAATAQKQAAALWPKRAAPPAAAATLTAHHQNPLVSFRPPSWSLIGFFPLKCSLQKRQCSACRGSWALLLFAFATRDEL